MSGTVRQGTPRGKPRQYTPASLTLSRDPEPVTLCALDISSSAVGLAVVRFGATGNAQEEPFLLRAILPPPSKRGRDDTADDARLSRIRYLRAEVKQALRHYQYIGGAPGFSAVAYEQPNTGGAGATAGIHQAIGAVLTIGYLSLLPLYAVHATTVKRAAGIPLFRARGQTAESLGEKGAAVRWASASFGVDLCERFGQDAEHVADALCLARAAWDKIRAGDGGGMR